MNRRQLLLALAGLSAAGRLPAQPALPRVGVLVTASAKSSARLVQAFVNGMTDLGYQDGKNVRFLFRYGDGDIEKIRENAKELVAAKVEVIWTGSMVGLAAAQAVTKSLPIVFAAVTDPVAAGIVRSLAHPGTNASGLTGLNTATAAKRIEILSEAFPKLRRIGVLCDPADPASVTVLPFVQEGVKARGKELMVVEAREPQEFETALGKLVKWRADALVVVESVLAFLHRKALMDWAAKRRLPTMGPVSDFPEAGGLMSYGIDAVDNYRRSAAYVDKILKGAKVAELPVQEPTKFELVVNLKTAKAIGASIPRAVLLRADRIIE